MFFAPERERELARLGRSLDLARVATVHRGGLELATAGGTVPGFPTGRLRHTAATAADLPAVGDWVAYHAESGAVHAVLERTSALVRAGDGGWDAQVLAANVDLVVVVGSLNRELNVTRLERMVTLAADAPADALVALSKADLAHDATARVAAIRAALGGLVPVLPVSSVDGTGLDALAAYLGPGVTAVLLGSSGVGKTTLLNRLTGGPGRATGAIRESDDRGRHVTTVRELVPLASGGVVIDTPGLKLPRIWEQASGIATSFADVEALVGRCRFADCRHDGEPGCAVRAAVDAGTLAAERVEAYDRLRREEAWVASRRDARAQSERRRAVKRQHRELRRILREKGR